MSYRLLLIALLSSACFGQSTFDQSEKLFNKYLLTDSTKAKEQLNYQRKHSSTRKEKTRYMLNQTVYYNHNNRFDLVESWLQKTEKQMDHNDVALEGEFIRIQSLMYFKQSRFQESKQLLVTFFQSHKSVPTDLKIQLQLALAEDELALGDYSRAHQRALSGYRTFRKKPEALSNGSKIRLLNTIYSTCYYQAKYDSALYYLYQSERYMEKGGVAKASFYGKIAVVYTMMGNHHKAIVYYKKSIDKFEKSNAPILLAYAYFNLGESTKEIDQKKAIPYYEKALRLGRESNYELIAGYALAELGDCYLNQKKYTIAAKYNSEALEIMRKSQDPHGIANALLNMGRQEYETGHFDPALEYLNEALDMTLSTGDLQTLEYCYEYLYKSYEHMEDYKWAHHYYKLFAATHQKIVKADVQENIEKLNLKYHVRLVRATNKLLQKEVTLKTKKLDAERNVKWLLGILLFALLIAGWFLRRFLIQRTRLKEFQLQLSQKEVKGLSIEKDLATKELETVKDQLISKNNLISELNKLLRKNEQSLVSKDQFGSLITNDTDWVEFLAKLQLVFPDFIENLKTKHPLLSNNEFRLAALIRLNLSDKEISDLLIIELASVKKAKNRLKQKLGLDANDKLGNYIGQL